MLIRAIHLDWLWILLQAPDAAGADARAETAANALRRVGYVFPTAVFRIYTGNRLFWAGIDAHTAVAAGTAGNAARVLLARVRQIAVMAFLEVPLREPLGGNPLFREDGRDLLTAQILVDGNGSETRVADGVGQASRLYYIARREDAGQDHFFQRRHEPIAPAGSRESAPRRWKR